MIESSNKRLLVIDVAALSRPIDRLGLEFRRARSVFPAVTCVAQASFRTATPPAEHGMVSNGIFCRHLRKAMFWEQSAGLVAGERIWRGLRARGGKVAMLFWQQGLGEDADIVLSPAPIHKHHGGMIEDCYAQPAGLYARLCSKLGRKFKLHHYWGPLASAKVGEWIADATAAVLTEPDLSPDLCLTYLPSLDYDLQRHDPSGPKAAAAHAALTGQLARLITNARAAGYEVLIFGDYAIKPVSRVAWPNRALAEAGLLKTRPVRNMLYPDLYASRAFAMVDHQAAHVYVLDPADVPAAADVLRQVPGVSDVMDRQAQQAAGVAHPSAGELVLQAEQGTWFAYPWWTDRRHAPDYAWHVDIHNKPGYDPCELFWGWPPGSVGQDASRIRGSHARVGPDADVAWAATFDLPGEVGTLIDLAAGVRNWLDGK